MKMGGVSTGFFGNLAPVRVCIGIQSESTVLRTQQESEKGDN